MDDKILRRVRQMFDIASRETTPEGEREAAMDKAMSLMAAYGLTKAHLVSEGREADEIGRTDIAITDPYSYAKVMLVHHLSEALRCKAIITKQNGKRYQRIAIVGADSDRERVEMLYTNLLVQSFNGLRHIYDCNASRTRVARSNYLRGFAFRAAERVAAIERAAVADDVAASGSGAEVVLFDRNNLVVKAYKEMFPEARATKKSYQHDDQAWNAGKSDADRADLGQSRVNGGRRELTVG